MGFQLDGKSLVLVYCKVAVQSWIAHNTTGICWVLASKVKENIQPFSSFSYCRERKEEGSS